MVKGQEERGAMEWLAGVIVILGVRVAAAWDEGALQFR